jgi:hypothetical protein
MPAKVRWTAENDQIVSHSTTSHFNFTVGQEPVTLPQIEFNYASPVIQDLPNRKQANRLIMFQTAFHEDPRDS